MCVVFTSSCVFLAGQKRIVEELWQKFFSDPSQWWDHRSEKVSGDYLSITVRVIILFINAGHWEYSVHGWLSSCNILLACMKSVCSWLLELNIHF